MKKDYTIRAGGFTLVELLVVLLVLALLTMLVVPSIQRAVALAQHTNCQGNLHAMVNAHALYSSENWGSKPPLVWTLGGKTRFDWASPNIKMENKAIGQGVLVKKGYLPFKTILCPSSSMSADGELDEHAWRNDSRAGCSYAYFWRHKSTAKNAADLACERKYSSCELDNRSALIMDINANNGHRYLGAYKGMAWESHPLVGFVNIAYIDGRLRAAKNEEVKLRFPFNKTAEIRWWDLAHKRY